MNTTRTGTIDNPVTTRLPAEHYTSILKMSDTPALVITIDLSSLLGEKYQAEGLLTIDDENGIVSILCYPPGAD
jgi:hypothetical protein